MTALGEGPVIQLLFTSHERFETPDHFVDADPALYKRFAYEMISRGVLLLPAGKIYISLAHSDADIDTTVSIARDSYRALLN